MLCKFSWDKIRQSQVLVKTVNATNQPHKKEMDPENIHINSIPPLRAGCDTRPTFKQSFTGFNSDFSFSPTSCHTQVQEPSLPSVYLLPGWESLDWFLSEQYQHYEKCKQPRPGFELGSPSLFLTKMTITPLGLLSRKYTCCFLIFFTGSSLSR